VSTSKNATYNLIGAAVPSILTLVTVPLYLHMVGAERYGILTLCWVILGYASFLDLGLGYVVARGVAAAGTQKPEASAEIFWTALWISVATSVVAAAAVYLGSILYFTNVTSPASDLSREVIAALPLLAASVPVAMIGSVVGGAIQGRERFLIANIIARPRRQWSCCCRCCWLTSGLHQSRC
jgi:O-antigen/teichoic acid export membrane protein